MNSLSMNSRSSHERSIRVLALSGTLLLTLAASSAANTAPTITPIGDKTVDEQSLLSFTVTATDPESPPQTLTFTPEFGFPDGASITPDGVFTWTPNEFWGGVTFGVIVRVTDNGDPPMSDTDLFFITVNEGPPTPIELTQQLIADVQGLTASGVLLSSQSRGLIAKLDEAIKKLEAGESGAARRKLGDFVSQVEGLIRTRKLSSEHGQPLIDSAEFIIESLGDDALVARVASERTTATVLAGFELAQNSPNPFHPSTEIRLRLPASMEYALTIYDVAGRLVRSYSGLAGPGETSIAWQGTDEGGNQVGPGLYFYRVRAGDFMATRRMLLLSR